MPEAKTVTLIDPLGRKVRVSHPADVTNLVYGQGYKVEGRMTPDEAAAELAEKGAAAEDIAAVQETQTRVAK